MRNMRSVYASLSLLTAVGILLTCTAFLMPDVTYTTVTKVNFAGAVGKVVDFFAKRSGGTDVEQTIYLKGDRMRTDDEKTSNIIDLANERFIQLDHDAKTYSVMTFEDLFKQMEEMAESAAEEQQQAEGEVQQPEGQSNTEYTFDLKITPTGEKQKMEGYNADRVLMTITVTAKNTAPAESEEQGAEGTMVLASELWMSKDADWYSEVNDFNKRMAERMGETASPALSSLGQSFAAAMAGGNSQDPRTKEALEEAQEEAAKLEGIQVRNTTHLVLVPQGMEFDSEQVFATTEKKEEPKKKGGFGRFARRLAEQAVSGNSQQEEESADDTPRQVVMMTMTTDLQDVDRSPIPDSMFDIPADYKEVELNLN